MKFGKICLIALIAFAGVVCSNSISAAENNEPQWIMRPVEKLGRGIANVAFGVYRKQSADNANCNVISKQTK